MAKESAPMKSRYAVVVLGMHRSGTSALAGVMGHLGCDLPKMLMPANEANQYRQVDHGGTIKSSTRIGSRHLRSAFGRDIMPRPGGGAVTFAASFRFQSQAAL